MIDLTTKIDVEQFYRQYVQGFKKAGTQATGLCPFHQDGSSSFSMDLKTGQSQCFAGCFQGNMVTFYGRLHNLDNKEAFKALCEQYGIEREEAPRPAPAKPKTYGVAEYAAEKNLDTRMLRLLNVKDGNGRVEIPYGDENGTVVRVRYRYAGKQFKWSPGDELCLYGLWRMDKIRGAGYVVLVEGESDAQSLIQMGIPSLGVPGATTFKSEWAEKLEGLDVIVHDEGDKGAEAFLRKVSECLGRPFKSFRCRDIDDSCKDPNAVLCKFNTVKAKELIDDAIANAKEPDVNQGCVPASLVVPPEYDVSEGGILRVDGKEVESVTSTPMWLSSIIRCTESATEKVELSYYVRGRKYKRIFDRDVLLSSRSVVNALAPLGINISTVNAMAVVGYLGAFDAANHDRLPLLHATPRLGWADGVFVPYDEGIVIDDGVDERKLEYLAGFKARRGTLEQWAEVMEPHRWNQTFRFILASSFASPLLDILKARVFIVYNWASSRGGKTAAMKAAMSVWGDPEHVVSTFNGTQNAIEAIAGFMNHMPLAIDERQMRVGKGAQDALDQLIYTLSSGRGKDRGTKNGGLRTAEHWRCVVMATGEMPISGASSQTGVMTRTLEIEGSPFDYDEQRARAMHDAVRDQYGTAGRAFIEAVKELDVKELYEKMRDDLRAEVADLGSVSSHVDSAAVVAVADYIASQVVFKYEDDGTDFAWSSAKLMAAHILRGIDKEADVDNGNRALDVILDWIATNSTKFTPNDQSAFPIDGRLGEKKHGGFCLIGTCLREHLERHGFNVKATVKQLGDKGYFRKEADGSYTRKEMVGGKRVRCYFLNDFDEVEKKMQGQQTYFGDLQWEEVV